MTTYNEIMDKAFKDNETIKLGFAELVGFAFANDDAESLEGENLYSILEEVANEDDYFYNKFYNAIDLVRNRALINEIARVYLLEK